MELGHKLPIMKIKHSVIKIKYFMISNNDRSEKSRKVPLRSKE
jgi:hypothetical protein